jgi:general stress protein 26
MHTCVSQSHILLRISNAQRSGRHVLGLKARLDENEIRTSMFFFWIGSSKLDVWYDGLDDPGFCLLLIWMNDGLDTIQSFGCFHGKQFYYGFNFYMD